MAVTIEPADLLPFAPDLDTGKAAVMIADAVAMASVAAPCISQMTDRDSVEYRAAVAIIRGAIIRWHEAGSGASVQQGAGPFQQTIDTRQPRRGMFWPSEISDLQKLCKTSRARAFTIDMTPRPAKTGTHPLDGAWVNGLDGMEPGAQRG
ncbi:hypothetical protein [Nocardia terpenica]|uniref:hypothetical protein n=1 Tax=Nocardia terpenica TaxID=455432 RepID=UPI001581972B|nr:hypothetical protein [Nocardia terpenica]